MASQSLSATSWNQTPRSGDGGKVWTGAATVLQSLDSVFAKVKPWQDTGFVNNPLNAPKLIPVFPAFSLPVGDYVSAATITVKHLQGNDSYPGPPDPGGSIQFENTGTTLGGAITTEIITLNPLLFTVAVLNAGGTMPIELLYKALGSVMSPSVNGPPEPWPDQVIFNITTAVPPPPGSIVDNQMQVFPGFSEKVF